jgi:hypothetical protein
LIYDGRSASGDLDGVEYAKHGREER